MTSLSSYNSFFFPPYQSGNTLKYQYLPFIILTVFLLFLGVLGYYTIEMDHPFGLATESRALYVDEGFYADAAQNFAKFGQWMFPFDSRHWPGAPFLTVAQTIVFSLFGVSLEAARLLSITLSLISCLALYGIARASLTPVPSLLVSISAALTFSFLAHARTAIPDPVATAMAMLAFLVYIRVRSRSVAIPLSLVFSFFAFFTKMYFLAALMTIIFLWAVELLLLPKLKDQEFDKKSILVFIVSLLSLAAFYLAYFLFFREDLAVYHHINKDKMPIFDLAYLYGKTIASLVILPFNTKTNVFLVAIGISLSVFLLLNLWPKNFRKLSDKTGTLGRAEYAISIWLTGGILMIGVLPFHNAHYQLFSILPIIFIAAVSQKLIFSGRALIIVISIITVVHLSFQVKFYKEWIERPQQTAIYDASRSMVEIIHSEDQEKMIPVIGEYSAELALFSDRMLSLDAKWVSFKKLCERVTYWKPQYHVNIVWPGSGSSKVRDLIAQCDIVEKIKEIERYKVFDLWNDEIVLTRISYKEKN